MPAQLRPKVLRNFVVAGSLAAGCLGLLTLALDLTLPTYAWVQDGASGQSSLLAIGLEPRAATYILMLALISCALVLGGLGVRSRQSLVSLAGVVISGTALVVASILGGWFIGPSLFPAAAIALADTVGALSLAVVSLMSARSTFGGSHSSS